MYVTINPHNMAEIESVAQVLNAPIKYVIDLFLDSIINDWGIFIPHQSISSPNKHKFRLSDRHLPFVEQYATQRHVSVTLAINLILNDYFSNRLVTEKAKQEHFVPVSTKIQPVQPPKVPVPTTIQQETVPDDKPEASRGEALLQNLRRF